MRPANARSGMRRAATAALVTIAVVATLSGCVLLSAGAHPHVSATRTRHATPKPTPSPTPTLAAGDMATGSTAPAPATTPVPSPTVTSVPQGTVVAEGSVASPKGSIHFHYRMIADGDNTYTVEYSRFTSTVPVPVSVTLIDVPPRVGDGLTYHGVGDHLLGGPTAAPAATSTAPLGDIGPPSYLGTLVTYSSAAADDSLPVELGPDKVLAVNTVHWSIPARQSNVHPVDGGSRAYAAGTVTATTPSGAPKRYLVAHGDTLAMVATRFGISSEALIWLNPDQQLVGADQYLFESTNLNLDPDSL